MFLNQNRGYIYCRALVKVDVGTPYLLISMYITGTTYRFLFSSSVILVSKFKLEQITIPLGNIILVSVFYQLLMVLGDSILLEGLKLGFEVLDILGLDAILSGCRADGDLVLDDYH